VSEPAYLAENPHAGQGPVMVDIGYDTGALILKAPVHLVDREIEIHPFGQARVRGHAGHDHAGYDHAGYDHAGHEHENARGHAPHAAVIARPLPSGEFVTCAVFPSLRPGAYTLKLLPDGPSLPVVVKAGEVSTANWLPGCPPGEWTGC
jgi:hypothetical protein